MRLDQFLQESSIGARKLVRTYIHEGKVSVNGTITYEPSIEINEVNDNIMYLSKKVSHPGYLYYMFHKPSGCITARKDLRHKTVMDYFEEELINTLVPIGRLDKDTEGLLLLTNDGRLNNRLMNPTNHVDKTYFFLALGCLLDEDIKQLKTGVSLVRESKLASASDITVTLHSTYQELYHKDIEDGQDIDDRKVIDIIKNLKLSKDIKINPHHQAVVAGTITISEGRKHQVRRMLRAVGCYVIYLKRISIASLKLDDSLALGEYRRLKDEDLNMLIRLE